MNKEQFWKQFPLGSHLCREPMTAMSELKHDMEILKKKGFNLVKLQENWMVDEPIEGEIHLDKYHELIEYAGKLDMGVYLGLTCEQAPNWLWEKHPDCRIELIDGRKAVYQAQTTLPADGKPGPCYDHPDAMADQLRFIQKLVTELGEHKNIVVWNTCQEINHYLDVPVGGIGCYCPNTILAYQAWLTGLYGDDVANLNGHWNARYSSFSSVLPDRGLPVSCTPQKYYFRYFMDNVQVAEHLKAKYEAVRGADQFKRPIFAHKASPAMGSGMDWTYARSQDFLGTSAYPAFNIGHGWDDNAQKGKQERSEVLKGEMWDALAYSMDFLRSASKTGAPVWAAEYQGGPASLGFWASRVPNARDIRRWMLTTMGAGATAISFWVTRAEIMAPECNGFALLDSEGDNTERLEEAGRIGSALRRYPDLFGQNNKKKADVAFLIDEWNYQIIKMHTFIPEAYAYNLRGWYKTLWSGNIPCDYVEALHFDENYKAIIVPMAFAMSDKTAEKLLAYVKNGGSLILEGACGRINEVGMSVRSQINPLIREALAIRVEHFKTVREPGDELRWSQPEFSWISSEDAGFLEGDGPLRGFRLRAGFYIETYHADDTDSICLRWHGKPAGITKQLGKGRIWLIGTCLGPNAIAYIDKESCDSASKLLALCGIDPVYNGRLLLQKRISENREAWFFTNPEKETVTEEINIPKDATASDLLGGELKTGPGAVRLTVKPLDVQVLILERHI